MWFQNVFQGDLLTYKAFEPQQSSRVPLLEKSTWKMYETCDIKKPQILDIRAFFDVISKNDQLHFCTSSNQQIPHNKASCRDWLMERRYLTVDSITRYPFSVPVFALIFTASFIPASNLQSNVFNIQIYGFWLFSVFVCIVENWTMKPRTRKIRILSTWCNANYVPINSEFPWGIVYKIRMWFDCIQRSSEFSWNFKIWNIMQTTTRIYKKYKCAPSTLIFLGAWIETFGSQV